MLGQRQSQDGKQAKLDGTLPENDSRQDYIRAAMAWRDGALWVKPHPVQDSSMLKVFAESDALIVRAPNAAALDHGASVEIITL
jgi:molybdopterin molybdotransferase